MQKGAKNWVQQFFKKNVSARVLHDFRDLNFVTRFIVFYSNAPVEYASIYTALNFLKATCPPHFKA